MSGCWEPPQKKTLDEYREQTRMKREKAQKLKATGYVRKTKGEIRTGPKSPKIRMTHLERMDKIDQVKKLYRQTDPQILIVDIAKMVGLHQATVRDYIKRYGVPNRRR